MNHKKCPLILVTGGAGFIGSALIAALNEQGIENILVTDAHPILEGPQQKHLDQLRYCEYLSSKGLLEAINQNAPVLHCVEKVFHLGACSSTTETNRDYLMTNNFEYTKRLAKWSLAKGARFIYASSAATYGDGSEGMQDGTQHIEKFHPLNLYGLSKQLFDLYAKEQGWFDRIVGLKYFNVFGPNEDHKGEMRSLVCKAYEQIKTTGKMRLFKSYKPEYEDGEQQRDFIYIKDAIAMTLYLADHYTGGGLFNIGTGEPRTWLDLAHSLFQAMERTPVIEFIEMPKALRNQYQYYTCADISLLHQTGYMRQPFSLEDSVKDYVRSYLQPKKILGEG